MLVLPLDSPGSLLQGICLVVVYNVSRSLFCDRVYVSSKVYSSQDNLVLSTELIMHTGHSRWLLKLPFRAVALSQSE